MKHNKNTVVRDPRPITVGTPGGSYLKSFSVVRLVIHHHNAEQKSLLQQLGLGLPAHFELNRKCSADSAIA
jgi:hypothetical protein